MKKVLMFQDYFYHGGIEKVILDIKDNIGEDYNIDILSMVNKSNEKINTLLNKDYRSFFKRVFFGIRKYEKYLKNNHYDIIHIHCYNAFGIIYAKIASKYYTNVIIHAHNSDIDNDYFYIKHLINSIIKILFKSDKYLYIAVSDKCNKFCFNNKRTIIIPNGIDYQKYLLDEDKKIKYQDNFHIRTNDIVIGHIGRFEKQKNHKFIIEIFNEICKIKNNYKLILIGDGKLKSKVKKLIKKYNLGSKIIILDQCYDINKLINMFDIYLFPSIYEGFPISLLENEVNGKYVFMSDIIDRNIIVSNRVNQLSLSKNARYWANEIINLKTNSLYLNNRLDIKKYINKIQNIYRGFYGKNKKS